MNNTVWNSEQYSMEPEMRSEGLLRTTNQMFDFKASDILYRVWKERPAPFSPQSHNLNYYRKYHGGLGFSFGKNGSISRGTSLNTITFIQVLSGTVNFLQQAVNFELAKQKLPSDKMHSNMTWAL